MAEVPNAVTPPATEITEPVNTQPPPATGDGDSDTSPKGAEKAILADLAKERKERQRLAKELDEVRTASLSEAEKAVAEAEKRGRTAAATEYGERIARSNFVAAAARRNPEFDADAVLDDLNLARFVGENGEPDSEAISKAVERLVPATGGPQLPSFDGGVRTTPPASTGMNGLIRKGTGRA
jgi:uncharacterized heparinase superfamily protein